MNSYDSNSPEDDEDPAISGDEAEEDEEQDSEAIELEAMIQRDDPILKQAPGWMPADAEALGAGHFRWRVGRTDVYADFNGVYKFERGGKRVECICDPETGIKCTSHS